jgi:hypothetical protein
VADLDRCHFVRKTRDNTVVLRPVPVKFGDSFGSKIDIDSLPPLLVKQKRVGPKNRVICSSVDINAPVQTQLVRKATYSEIFAKLRIRKLNGLQFEAVKRKARAIVQQIDQPGTNWSERLCDGA